MRRFIRRAWGIVGASEPQSKPASWLWLGRNVRSVGRAPQVRQAGLPAHGMRPGSGWALDRQVGGEMVTAPSAVAPGRAVATDERDVFGAGPRR